MRALVAAVILWAGAAQAAPDPAQVAAAERLHDAELAAQAAMAAPAERADEAWTAAGQAYLDATEEARLIDRADEALWNAAICFTHARAIGGALIVLDRIGRELPTSPRAADALVMIARLDAAIASYDAAARAFAEHAARFPADDAAMDSLENAAWLYAALGDDARATKAVERFAKLYGAKRPERAADLIGGLARVADTKGQTDAALALYARYLAMTPRDQPERALAVRVRAAALQWRAACPRPLLDGLCARRDRRGHRIAVARGAKAAAAQAELAAVRAAAGSGWNTRDDLREGWGEAALLLGERAVEDVLALPPPPPTGTTEAARVRFERWRRAWLAQAEAARRALLDAMTRPTRATLGAAARLAVLTDAAADTMPADEPAFAVQARDTAAACLAQATQLSATGEDVAICERIVVRRDPTAFPPLRERLPAAGGDFLPPAALEP